MCARFVKGLLDASTVTGMYVPSPSPGLLSDMFYGAPRSFGSAVGTNFWSCLPSYWGGRVAGPPFCACGASDLAQLTLLLVFFLTLHFSVASCCLAQHSCNTV